MSSGLVLLAPDKFKGTLTATAVAEALRDGITAAREGTSVHIAPLADGGDGSVAAAIAAGFEPVELACAGPLGEPTTATIAARGREAVIELASVCGLQRLPGRHLEPERSSTLGLGLAIRSALARGYTSLVVGLGGSASTDGGAGLLCGLGARIRDRDGMPVHPGAAGLLRVAALDLSGVDPAVHTARIRFAVDVRAPLLGPQGAAVVFGPQKGADPATVQRLERALHHWARVVATVAPDVDATAPGAGAAGGVGFVGPVLGAALIGGAETFLDLARFDEPLHRADLVVTGEGRLDAQTLMGKGPAVVARRSQAAGVPCIAVVGSRSAAVTDEDLRAHGFAAVHELIRVSDEAATDPASARRALAVIGAQIARNLKLSRSPWLSAEQGDPS